MKRICTVLDKLIELLFQQGAQSLRLAAGQPAALDVSGQIRPVTREPLAQANIMALVREIAPDGMKDRLDAESRMAFGYALDGKRLDVEILHEGARVAVTLAPARPRRSSAAISMPMEARTPGPGGPAPVRAVVRDADASSAAEERIQGMLRTLVESKSSDLHLRVGEPPIIRKSGEMLRLEGYTPLTVDELQALLFSIMPERNRTETMSSM